MYVHLNGIAPHLATFHDLRRQFDSMFSNFEGIGPSRARSPLIDTGDAYVLTVDVPGLSREDIELTVTRDGFELSASRKTDVPDGYQAAHRERSNLSVKRQIDFPGAVDVDAVNADLTCGVLTVTFPKAADVKPRRVEVKAAE